MKVIISQGIIAALAAYLRQLELSIHRASSKNELLDFLKAHSYNPSQVINKMKLISSVEQEKLIDVRWNELSHRATSVIYCAKAKFTLALSWKKDVPIPCEIWMASIIAIESVSKELSILDSNYTLDRIRLRQMLGICADLMKKYVRSNKTRSNIMKVQHLNSAYHIETVPIEYIGSWDR